MIQQVNFSLVPSVSNKIIDNTGKVWPSIRALAKALKINKSRISYQVKKKGFFVQDGITYRLLDTKAVNTEKKQESKDQEYEKFKRYKEVKAQPFKVYNFKYEETPIGFRYAVVLFSDLHIEETVKPEGVLGLNEYNINIATKRVETFFSNLAQCLNADKVDELIFGALGDNISGYIHEELAQCNGLTPIEATYKAQSLIFSGLKFLCEHTNLKKIRFIGIVGNHGRTTKKIQHANGFKLSYEWLMYKNIEAYGEAAKLPIEFYIPESELAIVNTADNKKFIFCHGFQIRSSGNNAVCGIYPALNRLALKWNKTINQDKIYLGHFHSITSIPNAVVNGSIIGYNTFALTNGFPYERPMQHYEVHDTNIGELLTRKIYCE